MILKNCEDIFKNYRNFKTKKYNLEKLAFSKIKLY